jgi:hypothetical protein
MITVNILGSHSCHQHSGFDFLLDLLDCTFVGVVSFHSASMTSDVRLVSVVSVSLPVRWTLCLASCRRESDLIDICAIDIDKGDAVVGRSDHPHDVSGVLLPLS